MARSTLKALRVCTLALAACVGTRTGNPYDDPPEYSSSSRFAPDPVTSPGNSDGGVGLGPWGGPIYGQSGRDLVATFEHYVALAVSGRGVLTVDVAEPEAPVIVGELPIAGSILQLEEAPGGVTAAVLELTTIDTTEVPEAPLPREVPRLLRVDLSDPARPRRAFELDLEGRFFALDVRGSDTFVLHARAASSEPWCGEGTSTGLLDHDWEPSIVTVTRYTEGAAGWQEAQSVELATDVGGALSAGPETWLVIDSYLEPQPLVRWVTFAEGSLVEGQPFAVDGKPRAADREGDVLSLVLEHGDGTLSLTQYTIEGTAARMRGRVQLPQRDTTAVELLASGGAIIDGDGAPAVLVDLSDLDAPRVASQLPSEVMRLVEAPSGLLGLGSSGGPGSAGDLVVTLWDASALDAPLQIGRVQTDWFYPHADPGVEPWTLDAERGLLLVPFERPQGEQPDDQGLVSTGEHLGVFELGSGVTLYGEQPSQTETWRPWTDGSSVFGLGWEGFEVLPLREGVRQGEPVSALLRLRSDEAQPIDELELDAGRVELWEREDDGVFYLEVTVAGAAEPSVIELPHRGDELVASGDRVVVLGMRGAASECEYFEQQGVDPSEIPDLVGSGEVGYDACVAWRARGISVLALDVEPRLVASLPVSSTMDVAPLDDVNVRLELDGYVPLPDGRVLVLAQRTRECNSYASCEALGVEAHESMGSPGCSSEQDCSDLPSVITFVNGYQNVLVAYVLDGIDGASPTLSPAATLEGRFELFDEGPLDVRRKLLSSEGTLAFARTEAVYGENGESVGDAYGDSIVRHFLDRLVVRADGSLEALAPVSTPGLPIALRDDKVFSLEPRRVPSEDDGEEPPIEVVLHRAGLHGEGAFIESSVELGDRFLGSYVLGDHLYALRHLGDPCEPGTPTGLSAVELATSGELELGDGLELGGIYWRFAGPVADDDDTLWLAGGPHPDARLALDLDDPARPRVRRYATPALP